MIPESLRVATSARREIHTERLVLIVGPAAHKVVISDASHIVDSRLAAVLIETGTELGKDEWNAKLLSIVRPRLNEFLMPWFALDNIHV